VTICLPAEGLSEISWAMVIFTSFGPIRLCHLTKMDQFHSSRYPNDDELQSGVCKSVHITQKTDLLHPLRSYQKDGNSALISMRGVLKCDYVALNISQPVFQVSPSHL
jgi:hypothetical protein